MMYARNLRSGQLNLIGTLVAVAILIILAAFMIPKFAARKSAPDAPRTPTERAYGAACGEYVNQINMAVDLYKTDHDGAAPRSLDDLRHYNIGDDILKAPGCTYVLDPVTGHASDATQGKLSPPAASQAQQAPARGPRGPGGVTMPPTSQPGLDPSSADSSQ